MKKNWLEKFKGWKLVRYAKWKEGSNFLPGAIIMSDEEERIDFILAEDLPKFGIPYVKDKIYRPNPLKKLSFNGAWK